MRVEVIKFKMGSQLNKLQNTCCMKRDKDESIIIKRNTIHLQKYPDLSEYGTNEGVVIHTPSICRSVVDAESPQRIVDETEFKD